MRGVSVRPFSHSRLVFCFKQKTAYEMRISDWSSDVCSSDLIVAQRILADRAVTEADVDMRAGRKQWQIRTLRVGEFVAVDALGEIQIGRASCRERVCQYG